MTAPAPTLLASGFGPGGGGLYQLRSSGFAQIDELETVGLAVSPSGDRLARALVGYLDGSAPAHLLMYDAAGVAWYRRGAGIHDVHGLVWTSNQELAVVSTATNSVHWLDDAGNEQRVERLAEAVDAWHLNCPALDHAGKLVVTAFGQTDGEQAWRGALRAVDTTGVLWDVGAAAPRFSGLRGPHDPVALADGTWLVNNSAAGELVHVDGAGQLLRVARVGGWTRGLALDDAGSVYVGVSRRRHEGEGGTASVLRLDLATLEQRACWQLPADEVFSLVWVDPALLAGVERGFGALPGASVAMPA